MSIAATHWALGMIAAGRAGSTATKLVLVRLADRADPQGVCWPGYETTARDLDLGERTVAEAIKSLAGAGLLEIERRTDLAGRDLPNRYHLHLDLIPPPPRRSQKVSGEAGRADGVAESATPSAGPAGRSVRSAPEPKASNQKPQKAAAQRAGTTNGIGAAAASGKLFRLRESGIETWLPCDTTDAESLEASEPPGVIAEAVATLRAQNKSPVPGIVRREINRRVREQLDEQLRRKNLEALNRSQAENERRQNEELATWLANRTPEQKALDDAWLASCVRGCSSRAPESLSPSAEPKEASHVQT